MHVTCRRPESEAARKAENERIYAPRRERAEKAKTEPATLTQVKYPLTFNPSGGLPPRGIVRLSGASDLG